MSEKNDKKPGTVARLLQGAFGLLFILLLLYGGSYLYCRYQHGVVTPPASSSTASAWSYPVARKPIVTEFSLRMDDFYRPLISLDKKLTGSDVTFFTY